MMGWRSQVRTYKKDKLEHHIRVHRREEAEEALSLARNRVSLFIAEARLKRRKISETLSLNVLKTQEEYRNFHVRAEIGASALDPAFTSTHTTQSSSLEVSGSTVEDPAEIFRLRAVES